MSYSDFIRAFIGRFRRDDEGAVTSDWVLLTALVIGLALATHTVWRGSAGALSDEVASTTSGYPIRTSFD